MQHVEQQRGKVKQKVEPEPETEAERLPAERENLVLGKDREEAKEQEEEKEKEEEDTSSKIKTRSRFSAAFRSLSKPKAKKQKEQEAKSEEEPTATQLEDVDSTDSGAAGKTLKKKSLTRRLLLGGLKKTPKARPHSLATSDEISVLDSSLERVETAPDPDQDPDTPDTNAPSASSSATLLQITISGKKVEPAKGKSRSSKSRTKSSASETDYLTPAAEASAGRGATAGGKKKPTTTTTVTTKDTSSTRTTKLIVAKKKQQSTPKPAEAATPKAAAERLATAAETGGKIAVTESTRDTPPRERAPAKPSRVQVQSASSTGAVRKSSASKKLELLQQQQQRGHRLSRQVASNATTVATPESNQVPALEAPPSPEPEPSPPTCPPPPPPVEDEQAADDAVSSAESAQRESASPSPVVRFAVGSAVRSPLSAYEAALAALANQPPSSSEEPSDSSLRRLSFAQQQLVLSDHDSIEGRRETLHYHSVASEYSNEDEAAVSEDSEEQSVKDPATANPMPAFGDLTMDQEMEPAIMTSTSEKREHLYKILVIGELGTGKTSFIKRYVHQFFSQNYRATIGVDFALKVLQWDGNTIVRLQLWDIAGQERFGNMTRVYYKEAVGAFIVFDVTRSGTFDCVSKWKEDLDSKVQLPDGSPIPCILLANKCDQEKQGIVTNPEKMDEYVRENGFAGWFETSAKENINIDEASRALVNKILINDKLISGDLADGDKFNLNNTSDATGTETKNKCSC
ncbi:ras-related protein Rab-44 isoform X1 [Drosophila subobscura]|uniref:ras-related protein Rab-44 isoform X1 n=1 Tax=Drosophila subobscura TaxID=7241 RepID=UPI00155A296A|nr:ras-related protein Rab-44 isoform X1 [Drosophila subobscura]